MSFDPIDRRRVGHTSLRVTTLALGTAPLGGLYEPVSEDAAVELVERAWELGVRYFDTAPLYGYGFSERILGRVLRGKPRDQFVVSSKVGRLVRRASDIAADADVDRGQGRNWPAAGDVRAVFDFSGDDEVLAQLAR